MWRRPRELLPLQGDAGDIPEMPRWLRRELSKVELQQRKQSEASLQAQSAKSLASSSVEALADAVNRTGLARIEPRQVLFLQSQFGLATSASGTLLHSESDFARTERERAQLEEADDLGAELAQRIVERRQRTGSRGGGTGAGDDVQGMRRRSDGGSRVRELDGIGEDTVKSLWSGKASKIGQGRLAHLLPHPASPKKERLSRVSLLRKSSGLGHQSPTKNVAASREVLTPTRNKEDLLQTCLEEGEDADDDAEVGGEKLLLTPNASDPSAASRGQAMPSPQKKVEPVLPLDMSSATVQEAFYRYVVSGRRALGEKETRMALLDLGLQPSQAEAKQSVQRLINEVVVLRKEGVNLESFMRLIPRVREVVREGRRAELEDWFTKCLDETGRFDMGQLKPCIEAFGGEGYIDDAGWTEVLQIFQEFKPYMAEKVRATTTTSSVETDRKMSKRSSKKVVDVQQSRSQQQLQQAQQQQPAAFESFETLLFRAVERLIVLRREQERRVAAEFELTEADLEEHRSELLGLRQTFENYDKDSSGTLGVDEVLQLLAASGTSRGSSATAGIVDLIKEAKSQTRQRHPHRSTEAEKEEQEEASGALEVGSQEVSFVEFLALMTNYREQERDAKRENLRPLFNVYDVNGSGEIAMKDMTRLFSDLGMEPRTRQEQQEIRLIFEDADENGDGAFVFDEFLVLIQRVQERLDRIAGLDEERYAQQLGMQKQRCYELRKLFQDQAQNGVLFVTELREVMNALNWRFSSEELHELFERHCREDLGGVDGKGFLRMAHSIEVARSPRKSGLAPYDFQMIGGVRGNEFGMRRGSHETADSKDSL